MKLVLMGPPGAGKGTQAKRLVDQFGLAHLSSGDIFRAEKAGGSELGQELARYMEAGELVPDDVVVPIMARAVTAQDGGLMLDGFPRTVPQAEALDRQLSEAGKPLDAVVVILADDEAIVGRITGRRSCPECGKAFHVTFLPSEKGDQCDACDSPVALVQREDDTEAVIRRRLEAYHQQTKPVVEYYRTSGATVLEVDGNASPDEVTTAIVDALRSVSSPN